MIAIPGQRVQPKGAASGSKASQRSPWELRLSRGSFFVVSLLVGVIIVSAYYLGFVSGKAIGVEAALSGTVATLPKLPIIPPLELPAEEVKGASEASRSLDSAKPPSPQPTVALKKDEEGLQPIPKLNLELPEAEKPAEKVGAKKGEERAKDRGESASAKSVDPLEKVLDERAISLKLTPTAIAEVREGEGDTKPGSKFLKEGTVPRGWYVQAAAVTTEDEANLASEKLVSSGFPVVIEDVKIGKKQYYRILVGPESEREPALRMVEQVKREQLLKGDPFLRRSK
jgi:cell division septation protein DedD